jgi:hypothetical protein
MELTVEKKVFDARELRNGWEHHFYFVHPITQNRRCQYYYRSVDGVLFSTIAKSWRECKQLCEAWCKRTGRK